MNATAASLLYYEAQHGVVCLAKSFSLTVYTKTEGAAAWKRLLDVKLPTMEGTSSIQVTWAGEHLLASASDRDSMVSTATLPRSVYSVPLAAAASPRAFDLRVASHRVRRQADDPQAVYAARIKDEATSVCLRELRTHVPACGRCVCSIS